MSQTIPQTIQNLSACYDSNELLEAVEGATRHIGLPLFAYVSFGFQNIPVGISNYPNDWVNRYISEQYYECDPVVSLAQGSFMPFIWGSQQRNEWSEETGRQIMAEAGTFGIHHGFTVPIRGNEGEFAAVVFAGDGSEEDFEKRLGKRRDELHLLAMHFHANVIRTGEFAPDLTRPRVTQRERECLKWAAQGKSKWATAKILGISERTVAFHLDNVNKKFDKNSVIETISVASKNGYI